MRGGGAAGADVVLELVPPRGDRPDALENLARALARTGQIGEARRVVDRWLAFEPDSAVARHMLAAYGGAQAPDRASDAFVRDTFDAFADTFDTVLEHLRYAAPKLVAEAVARAYPRATRELAVLDAPQGHDAFLIETRQVAAMLTRWRVRHMDPLL